MGDVVIVKEYTLTFLTLKKNSAVQTLMYSFRQKCIVTPYATSAIS